MPRDLDVDTITAKRIQLDNPSDITPALRINQTGDEASIDINQTGAGNGVIIETFAAAKEALLIAANQSGAFNVIDVTQWSNNANTGNSILKIHQNPSGSKLTMIDIDNHAATPGINILQDNSSGSATALKIKNDSSGDAIEIDQDGDGIAIDIDSESTTNPVIRLDGQVNDLVALMQLSHAGNIRWSCNRNDDVNDDVTIRIGDGWYWTNASNEFWTNTSAPTNDTDGEKVSTQ